MHSLLHGAHLGPKYWSWALIHAVYLKNRTPHRSTGTTPHQACTGKRPDISALRVFGSPIVARLPGHRPAKLDSHTTTGIFLGYTGTEKNVYYRDSTSGKIKIATHITFDEAGFTVPKLSLTPTQRALQNTGYQEAPMLRTNTDQSHAGKPESMDNQLLIQLLSDNARLPVQSTPGSAGLDLFSAIDTTIPPHKQCMILTDLAISPPNGTYCQIMSRSGMVLKHGIETRAGTLDSDFRGNVTIILCNTTDQPFNVRVGDRVAQLITFYIAQPTPVTVSVLPCTQRGPHGFGSTETGNQDSKTLQATTQDTQPEPGTVGQDTTDFLTTQLKTYQSTPPGTNRSPDCVHRP
jgi:dUTP pyrophosphatase